MTIISKRLSKGEKACLAVAAVGLVLLLGGALYMVAIGMFASHDTPMPVWCLVSGTAGFVLTAVGMKLHPRAYSRRIASEAISRARG
jgi:hypothetical protein